jgi:hypothetical protein
MRPPVYINNNKAERAVDVDNLTDEKTFPWMNDVPLGSFGFNKVYFKHIDPPRFFELQARINF